MTIPEDERIIQKSTEGWYAISGEGIRGSLILTNKRLMIGNSSNSFFLKDIIQIDFFPINGIQITLKNKTVKLLMSKQSIGHAIDLFTTVLFDTPFEAGSRQEEIASYTAHWASVLTTAHLLYGEPVEYIETKYEEKKAWCNFCNKYVDIQHSDLPVWLKKNCPICGRSGMTSLSPEDRKRQQEKT